jgi:hypothetical protein
MKNALILMALLVFSLYGCKTTKPAASVGNERLLAQPPLPESGSTPVNFSDPETWILGYFKLDKLKQTPHDKWFIKGYDDYQLNTDALNKLLDINKDNLTIKIVMGTWCPDSRREVPRLMRVIDICNIPLSKITFIGVDREKKSQVGEYNSLNIERVPTFILYKNNVEAGRIIENPATSLEQDMVNILTRNE